MAKLGLYLDTRYSARKSEYPLKISVSAGGSTAYIPTGISLSQEQWDKARQKVVRHSKKDFYNNLLGHKLLDYEEKLLNLEKRGMSAAEIKDALTDNTTKGVRLIDCIDRHIESRKTEGNKRVYRCMLSALRRYDADLDRKSLDDINKAYLDDFDIFMARSLKKNSRNVHLRCLRAVFNSAMDDELTTNYPFRKFRIRPEETRKRALSIEELRLLANIECEPYQVEYRDIFLLMFYLIGINAVDLFNAPPDAIRKGRLEYKRAKTHKLYSIKVEPEAMSIIDRYRGEKHLLNMLDRYSDYRDYLHHMNNALKAIGRRTGKRGKVISKGPFPDLSSYWSRHSWATIASSLDVPVEIIGRALGHSVGAPVTNVYIDFDMKKVDSANRKVIDTVNG